MSQDAAKLRLGFAGTPEFAVPALDALHASHDILAVFTQPDRGAGRGRRIEYGPVKARSLELGLPVHQPPRFDSPHLLRHLAELGLDALIVVAYGLLLPPGALSIPRFGCINIHASLLPRWRGAAPIQRAILAGDALTGISIMRMEKGLDTGPVLATGSVGIDGADTAGTLHDRLARLGARLLLETLTRMAHGNIEAHPQDPLGATYAAKIDKAEALIDWGAGAEQIARRVRAFNPWPIAETRLDGSQLRILEAHALDDEGRAGAAAQVRDPGAVLAHSAAGIDVACGQGVLRVTRLQAAGRKALNAGEFLRGARLPARLGA